MSLDVFAAIAVDSVGPGGVIVAAVMGVMMGTEPGKMVLGDVLNWVTGVDWVVTSGCVLFF